MRCSFFAKKYTILISLCVIDLSPLEFYYIAAPTLYHVQTLEVLLELSQLFSLQSYLLLSFYGHRLVYGYVFGFRILNHLYYMFVRYYHFAVRASQSKHAILRPNNTINNYVLLTPL